MLEVPAVVLVAKIGGVIVIVEKVLAVIKVALGAVSAMFKKES